MPRNAEVIRQWTILRELEASRRATIDDLAGKTGVTTRTIRRDLEALQTSGFPLFDELIDGKRYWMLEAKAFRRLDVTGFTLAELSALYFSRTLVECLAATPFQQDVASAFDKLATVLTPAMRQFLDRLPLVFQTKGGAPGAETGPAAKAAVARLLDATLNHRRATMKYFSMSSGREKDYLIEPYRLVYSPGGLYVLAFVPAYGELRTFAVERIRGISLLEERFTPSELPEGVFAHSLGVNQGSPEHVEILFEPRIAPYIRERRWHPSQTHTDRKDGGVLLSLDVCNDWALRSWILGFGPLARVLAPASLKTQIKDEIDRASERYAVE
ncbi:MAG TPA: WYL domain-containing protein [Vicinamibacterales bacterium]|jgi:predicted DNA-binding transcriptional regulator YafY|nr:WYL domain-containing protein [Vicinamibacterales bacterium]